MEIKGKKISPLLVIVLLTIAIGVVGAGLFSYFTYMFQHTDSIVFTVHGMDGLLLEPSYDAYMAGTPEMETVDNKAFIQGPIDGGTREIREMLLTYTDANLADVDLTVTVGGLPEGLEVDIRIGWYYCHLTPQSEPSALIGDALGATTAYQQSITGEYFDITWTNYQVIENGVPFALTAQLFTDIAYEAPTVPDLKVPNGLLIHISPIILDGYQGTYPAGTWGDFPEDIPMVISVDISGAEA